MLIISLQMITEEKSTVLNINHTYLLCCCCFNDNTYHKEDVRNGLQTKPIRTGSLLLSAQTESIESVTDFRCVLYQLDSIWLALTPLVGIRLSIRRHLNVALRIRCLIEDVSIIWSYSNASPMLRYMYWSQSYNCPSMITSTMELYLNVFVWKCTYTI